MRTYQVGKNLYSGVLSYDGWITSRDIFHAIKLVCCITAAFFPQRYWKTLSARLGRLHMRLRRGGFDRFSPAYERLGVTARDLERRAYAAKFEENIEAIREILPGGWHPPLRLDGKESLDDALSRQRGAILWVAEFQHSDLVTKKALANAGYALHHLSSLAHPYSSSRFGIWILNPLRIRAENRYLKRRVIVDYRRPLTAITTLAMALRENGTVVITAVAEGARILEAPLLGATLRLAAGAPMLALRTRAALIPVFTLPDEQSGFVVHIGPDISDGAAAAAEPLKLMTARFASLLETFVVRCPSHWKGWFSRNWMPEGVESRRA
jgi:lauroyl/myristoyl acyltransferase